MKRFLLRLLLIGSCPLILGLGQDVQPRQSDPVAEESPKPEARQILELDPTKPLPITGWWTNGKQTLHVDLSGAYIIYDGPNPYVSKQLERGRWHRQNYATFWLEPYVSPREPRRRVPLSIWENTLQIRIGPLEPMRMLGSEPDSIEGRLAGLWTGTPGTLELYQNMHYVFTAANVTASPRQPVVIVGHSGSWRVHDDRLVLIPDSSAIDNITMKVESSQVQQAQEIEDVIRLRSIQGTLEQVRLPGRPARLARPTPMPENARTPPRQRGSGPGRHE
ncbi:MAG: hypothetical protein CMJ32_04030 [Phycisphaerae bacterium]|nr:hypothetical protein [Phycisphaerae bacterium]